MKTEEQRIAIAEACGWKFSGHPDIETQCVGWTLGSSPWALNPKGDMVSRFECPDYLNDLNAMHEAEKVRFFGESDEQLRDSIIYIGWLGKLTNDDPWFATAAQRAEAFLRTLNLWKD